MQPMTSHDKASCRVRAPAKLRRIGAAAAVAASVALVAVQPRPAHGAMYFDYPWLTIAFQMAQKYITSYLESVVQTNITNLQNFMGEGLQTSNESISAHIEKSMGAEKELEQASLNYEAALEANRRATDAYERFAAPSAFTPMACQTAKTAQIAASAADDSRLTGKAMSAAYTRRYLYNDNSSKLVKDINDTYNSKFCTDEDKARGRGCTPVAPAMQGASLNAGSLLVPNGGMTYSPDELLAAREYVKMSTQPVPPEMLPQAMESTPQGQRFLIEQRAAAAQMSVANHSLSQILASRTATDTLASTAMGPTGAISVVGLMKKFVDEKFGSQAWYQGLQTTGQEGLLREIALLMAAKNWMDFQAYQQSERMEAVLATQLAIAAREQADQRLGEVRGAASSVKR